ncbi:glycosyltransferase [Paenibacillus oenotherae]|uniref:Glycosyltransferase n=2 Tax=Paenibacillus oenotherae TaxID=1435645 RepID=A0ABS7D3A7_9BACL|nr:glycosyltransferase [Paenibacillus oenotherae]
MKISSVVKRSRIKRRKRAAGRSAAARRRTASRSAKGRRTAALGRRRLKRIRLRGKRSSIRDRRSTGRKRRRKPAVVKGYESDPAYGTFDPGMEEIDRGTAGAGPLRRRVSIIILTWNGIDYTKRCLAMLEPTLNQSMVDVIVFDNGSSDGTTDYLHTIPWVKVIENPDNIGFVRGNNASLPYCDPSSDILLLNNDILTDPLDWLSKLQETALSSPDIGIVGCRLRGPEGQLHHAGTYILHDNLMGQQIGGMEHDVGQYTSIRDVQGIVFACAYIRRELINRIGFLDGDYSSYFEDTDYCLKAITAGYRIVCDGRVTLTHFHNTSTRVNGVDFWDIYNKSKEVFRGKWHTALEGTYQREVTWHSVVNLPFFGYAESSKNLMIALDTRHVKVKYRYVYGAGTPVPMDEPVKNSEMRVNLFRDRPEQKDAVQVVYGQGDVFHKNDGRYKVGYTMLEVDGLPADWVNQANGMDEVWVPSAFNLATFRNSGVHRPIHVMPLGVDTNYYHPGIRGKRFSEKFTFLSVFEWGERKAPEMLLRTFAKVFGHRNDVLLVCKIINNDPTIDVPSEIRKLRLGAAASNVIVLHNDKIPSSWMSSLYRSADCFVLPTRGEGWGMPVMEAMACGLPVITTNWSAQTDFINEGNSYPIHVKKLVPAQARCHYYTDFRWAEPDASHLAHLMEHAAGNRTEAAAKGAQAAHDIASRFTWEHAAQRIKNRLMGI